jgi:hypothetical protein
LFRPRDGFLRGLDSGKVDYAAFGFGDDFVFHNQDIAGLEAAGAESHEQFVGQGIAREDFIGEANGNQPKFIG